MQQINSKASTKTKVIAATFSAKFNFMREFIFYLPQK